MHNSDQKTKIVIIRHGNTFLKDETPRRVGKRTDLDLVPSGVEQAKALGHYFKSNSIVPNKVYSASLKRTLQTAHHILKAMNMGLPIMLNESFNEIDYGPDENLPEQMVIDRVGPDALKLWDEKGIPPQGWIVNPDQLVNSWVSFLNRIATYEQGKTTFIITSNGIARFLPQACDCTVNEIKIRTGSFGILSYQSKEENSQLFSHGKWTVQKWNERP